ncbi:hypothetical protein IM876_25625 [Serratia plymuthica]|uniref:HEPN domain-containing protein n=1 Tax=Serratia plymuthica TaxID=82996 RepID=UPI00192722C0|nr:HEPN domain-containing protein [Serratia plymuthica]MBL3526042.1 hypothetical protein [Serratia plymuthica]
MREELTIVDRLHKDFEEVMLFLDENGEVSLRSVVNDNFRKSLLLAAASYFERELSNCVYNFVVEIIGEKHIVSSLVEKNVINRKYHTWFDWGKSNNANKFFSLFGDDFCRKAKDEVFKNQELELSIKSFMAIGSERNRLVHQNFGSFTLEKTADEIFHEYENSLIFILWFSCFIRENCIKL